MIKGVQKEASLSLCLFLFYIFQVNSKILHKSSSNIVPAAVFMLKYENEESVSANSYFKSYIPMQ